MALLAHWKFDEENAGDVAADSAGAYPLTPAGNPTVVTGRFGRSRRFTDPAQYLQRTTWPACFADPAGAWSLSWWMAVHEKPIGQFGWNGNTIFSIRRPTVGTYHLARVFVNDAGQGLFSVSFLWSTSPSGQQTWPLQSLNCPVHLAGVWMMHTITRSVNNVAYYVNGSLMQAGVMAAAVDPGANPLVMTMGRGNRDDGIIFPGTGLNVDHFRIYDEALSAAAVRALFDESAEPPPDTTAPEISNVVPATGTPLAAEDPIQFDATDPSGNLEDVTIVADYPSAGLTEVVFFDGDFGRSYQGTRTPIAGGYRFSGVVRRGGWPGPPEIYADAFDAAGNRSA